MKGALQARKADELALGTHAIAGDGSALGSERKELWMRGQPHLDSAFDDQCSIVAILGWVLSFALPGGFSCFFGAQFAAHLESLGQP